VFYSPGPVVIKKDDKLLLNLTGTMSRFSKEKVLMGKYRGFSVFSMNKTRGRRNVYNKGKCGKLIEQLLSTFSVPSQAPSSG
jgi:hypothetical protein